MDEILITGTGRCGTGYMAQVLNSVGRNCSHEGVFNRNGWEYAKEQLRLRRKNPGWQYHAESSWLAIPFLEKPELDDITVVHLVRHPKDTMDSFLRMIAYGNPNNRPYFQWAATHFPTLNQLERPVDKMAYWYVKFNELAGRRADIFHRVEDDPRELLDKLGVEWKSKDLFSNTRYNSRSGHGPSDVQIEDVSVSVLRSLLEKMTEDYGYAWNDHRYGSVKAKWIGRNIIEISRVSTMLGGAWQLRDKDNNALCYDAPLVEFFYKKAKEHETPMVIDVGASSGNFALLPILHPGMTVHAFEPNPVQFRALYANVKLNKMQDRVKLHDCALADFEGEGELCVPVPAVHAAVACLGTGAPRERGFEWSKRAVKVRRLDSYKFKPDIIKIDVEGAELLVLEGARATIAEHKPGILLEYTSLNTRQFGYEREELITWLAQYGYTVQQVGIEDLWAEVL